MALAIAVLSVSSPGPAFAEDAVSGLERFPGGATAITETHEDWTVVCEARSDGKSCIASQTLGTREGRQAIAAMEVAATPEGAVNALLTMPFGLDLREGVHLDLDEGVLAATVPFLACTEQGCLVRIDIGSEELPLFRDGKGLRLSAKPADDEELLNLTFSLLGFASAFDRTIDLLR